MSRRPERIAAVLAVVAELWAQDPDMRLGQLLFNVTRGRDLFNVEDWDLVSLLVEQLQNRDEKARAEAWRGFTGILDSALENQSVTATGRPSTERQEPPK